MSGNVACTQCQGTGTVVVLSVIGEVPVTCGECFGDGVMSKTRVEWIRKGTEHRTARVERGESLRECADRYRISVRHLANMEHARTEPDFPS